MKSKLGLLNSVSEDDEKLVESLLDTMHVTAADFTTTFKLLEKVKNQGDDKKCVIPTT